MRCCVNRHKPEPALRGFREASQRSNIKAESSSAREVDKQRNVKGRDGEEKTPQGKERVCWKYNGKKGFDTFRVLRLFVGLNAKIGD